MPYEPFVIFETNLVCLYLKNARILSDKDTSLAFDYGAVSLCKVKTISGRRVPHNFPHTHLVYNSISFLC